MLHIEVLGTEFPGENEDGAAILVDQLRRAVDKRFPGTSQPKILFVDRGRKFYEKNHGKITPKFKEALTRNRFKAYYGDNAKAQPGAMHELMLHETAVSWIRYLEEQTRPKEPWTESVSEYASRMEGIAVDINKRHKVDNLCRALPKRVQKLLEAEGDRISKYSAHHHTTTAPKLEIGLPTCLVCVRVCGMKCKVVGPKPQEKPGQKKERATAKYSSHHHSTRFLGLHVSLPT